MRVPISSIPAFLVHLFGVTDIFPTDRRGRPRIFRAHVDIGAVELQSPMVVTNLADAGPGSLRQAVSDVEPAESELLRKALSPPASKSYLFRHRSNAVGHPSSKFQKLSDRIPGTLSDENRNGVRHESETLSEIARNTQPDQVAGSRISHGQRIICMSILCQFERGPSRGPFLPRCRGHLWAVENLGRRDQ